jgi:CTP-dependent riboflavin kinase
MKTPYQIAKELGVSSQAVYQKIERMQEKLEPYIQREDKKMQIDQQGEELLKSTFTKPSEQENMQVNVARTLAQDDTNVERRAEQCLLKQLTVETEYLREQVKSLQAEIQTEREHSRQQAERLAELADKLTKLTENSQVLMLNNKETLMLSDEPPAPKKSKPPKASPKKVSIWQKMFE